jgi:hypothetical protein
LSGKGKYKDPATEVPGPGSYSPPSEVGKAPAYSLSGKKSGLHSQDLLSPSPGPGTHRTKVQVNLFKGAYAHPSTLSHKGFTMGSKYARRIEVWSPGPGAYDLQDKAPGRVAPSFSMGVKIPT